MKIGTYGGCQSNSLAKCIEQLVPDAEIMRVGIGEVVNAAPAVVNDTMAKFAECDVVFIQASVGTSVAGLSPADFYSKCGRIVPFPIVICRSLQPDCVHMLGSNKTRVTGVMGPYHSALVAGAYQKGIPVHRVAPLFNLFTYRMLGYTDVDFSNEGIVKDTELTGYDVSDFLSGQHGRFMHTINHPTMELIFDLGKQALRKADIDMVSEATLPKDHLINAGVWPIYPKLAPQFDDSDGPIQFHKGNGVDLTLQDFIAASYQVYDTVEAPVSFHGDAKVAAFLDAHVIV